MGQIATPVWRAAIPVAAAKVFERGWWQGYQNEAGRAVGMEAFYAWAGSFMLENLAHRYTPDQLRHVRCFAEKWERRAVVE
jgi:hypothetical protein